LAAIVTAVSVIPAASFPRASMRLSEQAGVPFTSFDGDQADYRNYSEAQFETRIQGLVEVMKLNKEAKNNG